MDEKEQAPSVLVDVQLAGNDGQVVDEPSLVEPESSEPDPVGASEDEESSSSESFTTEPSSSDPAEISLPVESETSSSEAEPPPRRSTCTRNPPERLQYAKLGKPFLKSIQPFFHGWSTAFSYVLEEGEDDVSQRTRLPTVCSQPGSCTRTYIGSGGDSVTPMGSVS